MNYESPSGKAARAIRILLAAQRMSIAELAERSGVTLSTLKRRLLLASPFTIDELGLIAAALDVRVVNLLDPASAAQAVAA